MKKLIYLFALSIGAVGCSVDSLDSEQLIVADAQMKFTQADKKYFGIPTLSYGEVTENSLQIKVTAGENGATGGISVRWMTDETYISNGGWNNDLAGHVNLKENNNTLLGLNEIGDVFLFNLEDYLEVNDEDFNRKLECGLSYWFIVQASQDGQISKSDYSEPQKFSTTPCEPACTYGKGYWKNHGPKNPGNQENMYPVDNLVIAGNTYSQENLQEILQKTGGTSDLHKLKQHLIAVLLNIANGVNGADIQEAILQAEDLLKSNSTDKNGINNVKNALEKFNKDNACEDAVDYEEELE